MEVGTQRIGGRSAVCLTRHKTEEARVKCGKSHPLMDAAEAGAKTLVVSPDAELAIRAENAETVEADAAPPVPLADRSVYDGSGRELIADATDPEQKPLVKPGPVPGSFIMTEVLDDGTDVTEHGSYVSATGVVHRPSKHKAGKKPKHGQRDHAKAKAKAKRRAQQNQRPRGKKKGKSWAK